MLDQTPDTTLCLLPWFAPYENYETAWCVETPTSTYRWCPWGARGDSRTIHEFASRGWV